MNSLVLLSVEHALRITILFLFLSHTKLYTVY
jgi:hypothetical protein